MSPTIRLTKTIEFERILDEIRLFFPLLDDTEIIKMAVSSYYSNLPTIPKNLPTVQLTPAEERDIIQAQKDIENGDYKVVHPDEPIDLDKMLDGY